MSNSELKNLLFPKDQLPSLLEAFQQEKGVKITAKQQTQDLEIYTVSHIGVADGLLNIYNNKNGTTTFYPNGKNIALAQQLAFYLKQSCSQEQGRVQMTLDGFEPTDIQSLIDILINDTKNENGESIYSCEVINEKHAIRFKLNNLSHKDSLNITVYYTKKMIINGLPLSCYKEFIFRLSELLDASGLEKVISKTDESAVQFLDERTVKHHLKSKLPNAFDHLPSKLLNMLISSSTLKSVQLNLQDYSLLLFSELRALEGVLKSILQTFPEIDDKIDEEKFTFGQLFDNIAPSRFELNSECKEVISNPNLFLALNSAYSFFNKQRHTLFHIDNFVASSRVITDFNQLLALTDEVYVLIDNLYKNLK
ncbi:type II toxin-antitoxin system RnlA family toxin [Acinetobacter sp. HR7]|uniref:type II toxin-antitoxin system RnlA family toxin n=1 Tax=Acinetobacter sp. HR7 TaxID=1509403 RepID=UPI000538B867|nr:type II toxin-antitoxin system RnlA family toxin [Acinetobacter sp. HR7]KGT47306.1 hypothetical protein GW12_16650 [Acinetobacter sp. HR7]